MSSPTAIIDADVIKYAAAFVGQKNGIVVTHPTLNIYETFSNRTEFWGHHSKRAGGWLAEYNKDKESPLLPTEFTIEDTIAPEPIENVLHTCKMMYKSMHECIGATKHKGFIGTGDSFRVERSTLKKYKGTRLMTKPVHLDAVFEYLEKRLKCEVVEIEETDERVVQECYRKPSCIAVGEDKDYYGQPIKFFNINRPEEGIVDCNGFGKLCLDEKGYVRGFGRLWLYYQTMSKDDIDNYAANCFSEVRWGPKSAYKLLSHCLDDKQALQALVEGFKTLYPEPKRVVGWRGAEIDVDWLYVAQECFTMARMRRVYGEPEVMLSDVFKRLGVDYE